MPLLSRRFRSLFLLGTVLFFFIATPFLENRERGETFVVACLFMTLVAATVELSEKRRLFLWAIPLSGASMGLLWLAHVYHYNQLTAASDISLIVFIGLVTVTLYA